MPSSSPASAATRTAALGLLLAAVLVACVAVRHRPVGSWARSVGWQHIVQGTWSGLREGSSGTVQTHVIAADAAWSDLWQRHTSNQDPAPPRPDIDFSASQIVAVFRFCSSGGYGVRILRIEEQAEHVTVYFETKDPPKGAMTTAALTQPHDMVAIPRTDKPIRFAAHEAAPPKGTVDPRAPSTYILTFTEGQGRAPADVVAEVQALSSVRSVKAWLGLNICIVEVDPSTDAAAAAADLRAVEGVGTVERDAPLG